MHMTRLETLAKNGKKFSATSTNIACKKVILLRIYICTYFFFKKHKKEDQARERETISIEKVTMQYSLQAIRMQFWKSYQ